MEKIETKKNRKWLTKGSRIAKKSILSLTTAACMATMLAMNAFAAGEVTVTGDGGFIDTAITILKSVICLIGAGVGVWGVVNLLEGYGNDNPGAKSQGMKQLMAGLGLILLAVVLVPVLGNMMTGAMG